MSRERTNARRYALQALYQWQMAGQSLNEIERQFRIEYDLTKTDVFCFTELLHGVPQQLNRINDELARFVDRPVEAIDPVERAILWIGVYELLNRPDVPFKVVLNEGVNLAKRFGGSKSHKFINSILDKVAHQQRTIEIASQDQPASAD